MNKNFLKKYIPIVERSIPSRLMRTVFGDFIPIFMLHRFAHPDYGVRGMSKGELQPSLELFRNRGYSAISLEKLSELISTGSKLPNKTAVFTIDDGFIDQYEAAAPLFSQYDIPLTFFLITDFINGLLWPWDDQLKSIINHSPLSGVKINLPEMQCSLDLGSQEKRHIALIQLRDQVRANDNTNLYQTIDKLYTLLEVEKPDNPPREYQPLSWENALSLEKSGHSVAAHTQTHRILSKLTERESLSEIKQSIEEVNSQIGRKTNVFAYPIGRESDFGLREINYLETIGIKATVSTTAKSFSYHAPISIEEKHRIPRLSMPACKTDFVQYLSWIEFVKNKFR